MIPTNLSKVLEKPRLVFLVGAGISLPPPSNLLGGAAFTKNLIDILSPDKDIRKELYLWSDAENPDREREGEFLRFEGVMQALTETCDPELHVLDCLEAANTPNENHYTIARLLGLGHIVFTVNLDSLIERACLKLAIPFRTAVTDQDFQLEAPNTIYKLHGSMRKYHDGVWIDTRGSIKATLRSVGRGNTPLGLDPAKKNILSRALAENDLLVLGYSGYDDFDICPLLCSIESEKKIAWINHSNDKVCRSWVDLASSNKDRNGRLIKKHEAHLFNMGTRNTRNVENILLCDLDTAEVMRAIRKGHGVPETPTMSAPTPDWNQFFTSWQKQYIADEGLRYIVCGLLLVSLSRYDKAIAAMRHALRLFRETRDETRVAQTLYEVGMLHSMKGENEEALRCLLESVRITEHRQGEEANAKAYLQIGQVYARTDKEEHAFQALNTAFSLANECGDKTTVAGSLNAIANCQIRRSNYSDAETGLKEAYELFKSLGDVANAAGSLHNLGIVYTKIGDYQRTIECLTKCDEAYSLLGDKLGVASNLHEMGIIQGQMGLHKVALDSHMKTLQIVEQLGNIPRTARSWHEIGREHLALGDQLSAEDACNKSYKLFRKTKDEEGLAAAMHQIGALYANNKRYEKALASFKRSLKIYRKHQDLSGVARNLHEIGVIELNIGKVSSSRQYLLRALDFFEEVMEFDGIAHSSRWLGLLSAQEGDNITAARRLCVAALFFDYLGVPSLDQAQKELAILLQEVGKATFLKLFSEETTATSIAYRRDFGKAAFRITSSLDIPLEEHCKGENSNKYETEEGVFETNKSEEKDVEELQELLHLGQGFLVQGQFKEAKKIFLRIVEIACSQSDTELEAEAYGYLGICCFEKGKYIDAERYYIDGLKLMRANKSCQPKEIGKQLANLSNVYAYMPDRNLDRAEQTLSEALDLFMEAGDYELIASAYGNLGTIQVMQDQKVKAIESFEGASRFFEAAHLPERVDQCLSALQNLRTELKPRK